MVAVGLEVQALAPEAARSVLASDLALGADQAPALDALAERLGGSPLALAAASRAVRARAGTYGKADEAVRSLMLELDQSENPWRNGLAKDPFRLREGHVNVPAKPGLGIEVDEEVVRKYAV